MPYKSNKVQYTDTIRTLTDRSNQAMDYLQWVNQRFVNVMEFGATGSNKTATGSVSTTGKSVTVSNVQDFQVGQSVRLGGAQAWQKVTVSGTATVAGTLTFAPMYPTPFSSYEQVSISVASGDTASVVAGKLVTALNSSVHFTGALGSSNIELVVTAKAYAYNSQASAMTASNNLGITIAFSAISPNSNQGSDPITTTISAINAGGVITLASLSANTDVGTTQTLSHDDTGAVQNAIASAISNSIQEVFLPPGTYNDYGALTNTGSVSFIGDNVTFMSGLYHANSLTSTKTLVGDSTKLATGNLVGDIVQNSNQIGTLSGITNMLGIYTMYPPAPLVAAKGDGTTDDTAILNAIISNASVGATIFLGNHYCAGQITGSKRLNFVGQNFMNANSSAASLSGIKFADMAVAINWTGNVSFEKLILQGIGKDTSTGIGIQVSNGSLSLEKTTIQNFNTGVHVSNGYYNKLNNSYVGYCKNGIVFDNCYNISAVGLTVNTDTTPIQLNNNSTIRMLGGSVEGFQSVGINVTGNSHVNLFGTYFEGGGTLAGYGVQLANGCQVNAIGCHVYMTSMNAFISSADVANTIGISIFSRNNKIVYPTTAFTCTVYKFKLNDVTSFIDIAGDIWNTSAGTGVAYIDTTTFANQLAQSGNYSIIMPSNHPDSGSKDIVTKNLIHAKTKVTPATPIDGEMLFFLNNGFGTDDPLGIHTHAWGYKSYRGVYQNGQWEKVGARLPNQVNSTAPDVATLVTDFNSLLQKLRDNGIMI